MTIEITSRIGGNQLQDSTNILNQVYPIGSIYLSVNSTNPGTIIGGTWVAWGAGRVPLGMGSNGTSTYSTVEATGGEETHTLTVSEMPKHNHGILCGYGDTGTATADTLRYEYWGGNARGYKDWPCEETGGDGAHNNLQPYITCYMWKRTQ